MSEWRFMAMLNSDTFNEGPPRCRLFRTKADACVFIENEHLAGWDYQKDEPKEGLFERAAVFRILKSGKCKLIEEYSTMADSSGNGEGWVIAKETKERFEWLGNVEL